MVVTGPTLAQLFVDDDRAATRDRESRDGDSVELGYGHGREITEVPTCANCLAGCDVNSTGQQNVVQNALRRVDRIDGGMARKRWEKGDGQITKRAVGEIKRVPATISKATGIQVSFSRYQDKATKADKCRSHQLRTDPGGLLKFERILRILLVWRVMEL